MDNTTRKLQKLTKMQDGRVYLPRRAAQEIELDNPFTGYHVYKGNGGDCELCGARLEYWEHC